MRNNDPPKIIEFHELSYSIMKFIRRLLVQIFGKNQVQLAAVKTSNYKNKTEQLN